MSNENQAPAEGALTNAQIADLAEVEFKAGRLNWAGFDKDAQGVYMRPVVSPGTCDLVRAALAFRVQPKGTLTIERDEQMGRDYIPLPGGWEVQTKGNGSTFRICDTKTGDRMPIPLPDRILAFLERMAREVNAAAQSPAPAPEPFGYLTEHNVVDGPFRWQFSKTQADVYPDSALHVYPVYLASVQAPAVGDAS